MNNLISDYALPTKWDQREKLREKGQFWTPDWVARAMVLYVIENSNLVFDPAIGKGAFYSALKEIRQSNVQRNIRFYGIDIDEHLVGALRKEHLGQTDLKIEVRDFILNPPQKHFKSIVANPPYIRHHRLPEKIKAVTRGIGLRTLGSTLDGRAGLHVHFLIQALTLLQDNGKLAFIMPADTCEGVFAPKLWRWITSNYCLECVVTFTPEATPFPEVDTNPVIFLVRKASQKTDLIWVRVLEPESKDLSAFVVSEFKSKGATLDVVYRDIEEAMSTGLSRSPGEYAASKYVLSQFAYVMRGIATGANDYFLLTREEARKRNIPSEFLKPAISRTRDVNGFYITEDTLDELERKGRPTLLFSPDGRRLEEFPREVQEYLKEGEEKKLPEKPLISQRKPWYKMEHREPPPFVFAYLGRRNARFIRNLASVVPLTGFLCVYPLSMSQDYIGKLSEVLRQPQTTTNLGLVAKTYGSGAIKVEPRALERLPIPEDLVTQVGLHPVRPRLESN